MKKINLFLIVVLLFFIGSFIEYKTVRATTGGGTATIAKDGGIQGSNVTVSKDTSYLFTTVLTIPGAGMTLGAASPTFTIPTGFTAPGASPVANAGLVVANGNWSVLATGGGCTVDSAPGSLTTTATGQIITVDVTADCASGNTITLTYKGTSNITMGATALTVSTADAGDPGPVTPLIAGSPTITVITTADISVASAKVNSLNTVLVTLVNPGQNIASVDFSKWHIDVGDGGDGPGGPLTPASATITSAGTPWTITLTFSGSPFSINTAFSAAEGLYVDASGVTDTNGDTNIVIGHAASTIITDGQAPTITSVTSNATSAGVLGVGQTITFTASLAVTETVLTISPTTYNGGTITWSTANGGATYTAVYTVTEGQSNQGTALQLTGVTATDTAGNTSSAVSGSDIVKTIDANSPTTPVINAVATDNIINASERTATVTVTGTKEVGSTVTLNGNATNPLSGTTWNYVLDAATINAFGQGAETLTAIATDAAGNVNAVNGTRSISVDTVAPTFSSVLALKQDGTATFSSTNIWYYYAGKSLRFTVTANEPLSEAKACVRSITGNDSALTCSTGQFSGTLNTDYINFATNPSGNIYAFNTALSALVPSTLPTTPGGYPLNIQLTDSAGNITYSTLPSESFTGVFSIDPKILVSVLNNATTTLWSGIVDFTSVSNLTFNANDGVNDIGKLILTGPVNLTESATITGLQSLGTNMTVSGSVMRIDSSALAAFNGGATLTMKMSSAVRPGLIVKDNTGTIDGYVSNIASSSVVVGGKTLGSFTWDGIAQTLTFTTTGFSEFDSDNTAPTNQDIVFASSVSKTSSENVTVVSASETGGAIWFAPSGTSTFTAGTTMTTAGGTATSILAPSTMGSYKLYVIDAVGNVSAESMATLTIAVASRGSSGGSMVRAIPAIPAIPTIPGVSPAVPATPAIPARPSAISFTNRIHAKSSKLEVKNLQIILSFSLGQILKVDGIFGPKTKAAVKAFQKTKGLVVDGIIGSKTLAALNTVMF